MCNQTGYITETRSRINKAWPVMFVSLQSTLPLAQTYDDDDNDDDVYLRPVEPPEGYKDVLS